MALVLAHTATTGIIDAVSYVAFDHVFTAIMTGNMALLGILLAIGLGHLAGNVYAFVGFVIGSVLVGRFISRRPGPPLQQRWSRC